MRALYALFAAGLYTASVAALVGLATAPLDTAETKVRLGTVHVLFVEEPTVPDAAMLDREIG